MRNLLLASAIAFPVLACTPQQQDDTYAIVCASVSVADSGFQIYAAGGKVSAKVMTAEHNAVVAAQAVCSGPRPADVATAIAAVQRALTAIANATAQARAQMGNA